MTTIVSKLAFIFPGQGSQSLNMMSEIVAGFPQTKKLYDIASDILGYDLWELTQNGPIEKLNQTEYTQPALLVASIAAYKAWCETTDLRPKYVAGHSLGEYSALVAAKALDFQDAVQLVSQRGKFMQQAVPNGQGAMAAILGLDTVAVESACLEASRHEVVEAANINAPGQIVIAGDKAAVERACTLLKEMGAKRALVLPVSAPSHCALMQSAATKLEQTLEQVPMKTPESTLWHNVDVASHTEPKAIKNALVSQLYKPVQWIATVEKMAAHGVEHMVECGPGKVLSGLTKRINKGMSQTNLSSPSDIQHTVELINEEIHGAYES